MDIASTFHKFLTTLSEELTDMKAQRHCIYLLLKCKSSLNSTGSKAYKAFYMKGYFYFFVKTQSLYE